MNLNTSVILFEIFFINTSSLSLAKCAPHTTQSHARCGRMSQLLFQSLTVYLQVVVIVLQHCGSGSLDLPRCCRVAHSNENRPQMVFPALCSCTAKHSSRESHSNQHGYSEFMYLCHASALAVLFRLLFLHNLVWVFKRLYLHEKFERSASECGQFHPLKTRLNLFSQGSVLLQLAII